jgi:mycofactocin system glycosyltransferase
VIPAHDAAATVGRALAGLGGVGEVVVVDDGSTDETGALARAHGARVIRHETPLGPAAARNAGIRSTDHDLVLLLDADADPEPGWLGPLLAHLADPVVAGAAPRVRARGGTTALGRYEAAAGPLDLGAVGATVRPDGPVPFVSTTALLVRREAWETAGGFAEDLRFGEDLDLAWRLAADGRPLVYEPASTVWHGHRERLRDHLVNRYRYGAAGGPLARRHRGFPRAAVAPPVLTAAFVAGVLGARRTGLALAAASVAVTAGQLRRAGLRGPAPLRAAVEAGSDAARGLAAGLSRPWLPGALAAAAIVPRSRLPIGAALLARSVASHRRFQPDVDVASWMALGGLDDLAFSAGVIRGCLDAATLGPLLPTTRAGSLVERSVLGREVVLP